MPQCVCVCVCAKQNPQLTCLYLHVVRMLLQDASVGILAQAKALQREHSRIRMVAEQRKLFRDLASLPSPAGASRGVSPQGWRRA